MRLPTRLFALVVCLALVAGCGSTVPADTAATVGDAEVSRDLLERIVEASRDNAVAAAETTAEQTGQELTDEQRTQVIAAHQREMLSLLVQDRVITSIVADAGVEVTDADINAVRADIIEAVGGEEQLGELLAQDGLSLTIFDEVLVPQQARVLALRDELADDGSLDSETRTVRHILVETQEEADEVVDELASGADFAELASERSTDVGSAANGGELPPAPRGSYVPEFEAAVWSAELDQVVGPVQSQFGFHVLEVVAEDVTPASELDPAQVDQLVNVELNERLVAAYAETEIEVDAAFGEWDPASQAVVAGGGVGEVPTAPQTGSEELDLPELEQP